MTQTNWYDRAHSHLTAMGISTQDTANILLFYTQTTISDPVKWWRFVAEHRASAIKHRIEEFGGNNAAALAPFKELPS